MSRRAVAVVLCSLGVVLFLSRYALAIWYRGPNPSRWGVDDFGQLLAAVGVMPWVLAVIFCLVGFLFLALDERDHPRS